ncbi:bifunctional tetrahydrofolate synthase/dihydrofolate synthase [Vibrio albus]|jgi:dihydrofolate synthase/folylpolyglutamate synthase|uniref:Dihydrofolate synthase/folylpolyglutamate synthase n=1 Tax=Vibrio albus TaxID=2200953 RepID=A0A2U3BE42_9VIBR|nr:bifunctional tetrahydrofolate synthase/dihydrofolate synthase [Vibrio albus]PWI35066.1 bifunctional tetrahydrofolate synthase/dihydrofolate synthase [Vibrio albus]
MSQQTIPQATSSLAMWLDYLENIHTSAIDLGLERVQQVAEQAHLLHPQAKVITVAGTNGKGSTCALLESILLDAGYSVGVYSSPHLIRYNERVRINGHPLPDSKHTEAFAYIEEHRADTSLSFFEFGTLAALRLFETEQVDVILLEVGLGGRLDATNILEHDVAVVTSIAKDHVDWLGDDINVIAQEKAGIFRAGKPAICGQPDAPYTIAAYADEIGANLYQVDYQFQYEQVGDIWNWKSGPFDLSDLPVPSLPLPNAATALMALGVSGLDISDVNIVNGLKNAKLAGRMQKVSHSPCVILDVAHNPHSAAYLAKRIQQCYPDRKIHCVLGMLEDKDIPGTIKELSNVVSCWYPCSLSGPRAASAELLSEALPAGNKLKTFSTPTHGFKYALTKVAKDDVIIVAGSFVTVSDVLVYLQLQRSSSSGGK